MTSRRWQIQYRQDGHWFPLGATTYPNKQRAQREAKESPTCARCGYRIVSVRNNKRRSS